jgi:DNA-directed RNA polymerase specialized sigma24 family protein
MDELIRYVRALVYLEVQQMTGEAAPLKSEVLLERAGLSKKEIADILDKNETAIAKSLSRARAAKRRAK